MSNETTVSYHLDCAIRHLGFALNTHPEPKDQQRISRVRDQLQNILDTQPEPETNPEQHWEIVDFAGITIEEKGDNQ